MKYIKIIILLLVMTCFLCTCQSGDMEDSSEESTEASAVSLKPLEVVELLEDEVLTGYYTIKNFTYVTEDPEFIHPVVHTWMFPYVSHGTVQIWENGKNAFGGIVYAYHDFRGNLISSESENMVIEEIQKKNPSLAEKNLRYRSFSDGTKAVLTGGSESGTLQIHALDAAGIITASSTEIKATRPLWRISDNDLIFLYDYENLTQFYVLDPAMRWHGPFTTASAVMSCIAKKDGTVIVCCEDFSTLLYDPVSDTAVPVTLYKETETSRRATQILYGDGVTYFADTIGMTEQRDGVETQLFTWETSELGSTEIVVTEVLSERRFLAWRNRGFDGAYEPVILHPAQKPNHEGKKTITVASVRCDSHSIGAMIAETVARFNRENEEYYIVYKDFQTLAVNERLTDAWLQQKERDRQLTEALLTGEQFDVILFGDTQRADDFIKLLTENGRLCDLSSFAEEVGIADGFRYAASTDKNGTIPLLPITGSLSVLLTKNETLPQGTAFTLDRLQQIADTLSEGQTLFGLDVSTQVLSTILQDTVDLDAGTCSFDRPEFLGAMELLQNLTVDFNVKSTTYYDLLCGGLKSGSAYAAFDIDTGDYVIQNMKDDPIELLRNGTMQFLSCNLVNRDSVAGLFYIISALDGNARLCGYPTLYADETNPDGCAYFSGSLVAGMMPGTDETEAAAKAFLQMFYTEEAQSDSILSGYGLPVTQAALGSLVEEGYYYFRYGGENAEVILSSGETQPRLILLGTSEEPDENLVQYGEEIYISKEQCDEVLAFLTGTAVCGAPDAVIKSIIDEELSAFDAGVRTREEAVKIIQSRVGIYLSE